MDYCDDTFLLLHDISLWYATCHHGTTSLMEVCPHLYVLLAQWPQKYLLSIYLVAPKHPNKNKCVIWQVWVSRCKETFSGKRTPPVESLMMIWFNLISTLRGEFERLQGPSDASEEARPHFLLKWSGSSMLQMVDGKAKWNYQPPRWLFPPSVPNI